MTYFTHPMGFGGTSFWDPSIEDFSDPDQVIYNGMRISRYNASTEQMVYLGGHVVNVQRYLANQGYDERTQFYGLHHDSAETVTGEWIRPLKQLPLIGNIIKQKEQQVLDSIWQHYGVPEPDGVWETVKDADDRVLLWEMDRTWEEPGRTRNMEAVYNQNDWDMSVEEIVEEVAQVAELDYTPEDARDEFKQVHEQLVP